MLSANFSVLLWGNRWRLGTANHVNTLVLISNPGLIPSLRHRVQILGHEDKLVLWVKVSLLVSRENRYITMGSILLCIYCYEKTSFVSWVHFSAPFAFMVWQWCWKKKKKKGSLYTSFCLENTALFVDQDTTRVSAHMCSLGFRMSSWFI